MLNEIDRCLEEYMQDWYGVRWRDTLTKTQQKEIQQAFLSGMHLCNMQFSHATNVGLTLCLANRLIKLGSL